jgi:hypothetical protein
MENDGVYRMQKIYWAAYARPPRRKEVLNPPPERERSGSKSLLNLFRVIKTGS